MPLPWNLVCGRKPLLARHPLDYGGHDAWLSTCAARTETLQTTPAVCRVCEKQVLRWSLSILRWEQRCVANLLCYLEFYFRSKKNKMRMVCLVSIVKQSLQTPGSLCMYSEWQNPERSYIQVPAGFFTVSPARPGTVVASPLHYGMMCLVMERSWPKSFRPKCSAW